MKAGDLTVAKPEAKGKNPRGWAIPASRNPRRLIPRGKKTWVGIVLPGDDAALGRGSRKEGLSVFLSGLVVMTAIIGSVIGMRKESRQRAPAEDVFVIEEELPPIALSEPEPEPPRPKPPPSHPEAQPVSMPEEEPLPRFGMEEEDLGETGDVAVATGTTLMANPDSVVEALPAPPPPGPEWLDRSPGILAGGAPEYPERALDLGLEGVVVALIAIDTSGHVVDVKVEKSAGRDFDREVIRAARATVFQAPMRQGRKLPALFRRPYEFRLE